MPASWASRVPGAVVHCRVPQVLWHCLPPGGRCVLRVRLAHHFTRITEGDEPSSISGGVGWGVRDPLIRLAYEHVARSSPSHDVAGLARTKLDLLPQAPAMRLHRCRAPLIRLSDGHVAPSCHSHDVAGLARIKLDLLPQVADMGLDERRVGLVTIAPDMRDDLIVRTDIIGIDCEQMQQLALRRRQPQYLAVYTDLITERIHPNGPNSEHRRRVPQERAAHAATERVDVRKQLGRQKRLDEVRIPA